jgi:rSAM/selenodomain-associated transferase 2
MPCPSVTIIIPVLNEEKILTEEQQYYSGLQAKAEVIFVDGGSSDATREVARRYGRVVSSPPCRGIQKNRGAKEARTDCLLFLHVDTFISDGVLSGVPRALRHGAVGGCLTMRIDDEGRIFRLYERLVNARAKTFGIIDGDLGTFVRREIFERLRGFDRYPVMEDLLFAKRLRRAGRLAVLPQKIRVSSRKWHERGVIRTFCDYTIAYGKLVTGRIEKR